ncbi:hypothetical protein AVEN_115870-1 [Araneus ventricosus]|uniref:Uncharacterized protein n=1 Tax=Araneus ventricosus TaxID=182803 RepID=A0A4Y2SFW0_ARAVE|nr:hypothetical protein AVEN_115870-1 [Araneus ventricosus]
MSLWMRSRRIRKRVLISPGSSSSTHNSDAHSLQLECQEAFCCLFRDETRLGTLLYLSTRYSEPHSNLPVPCRRKGERAGMLSISDKGKKERLTHSRYLAEEKGSVPGCSPSLRKATNSVSQALGISQKKRGACREAFRLRKRQQRASRRARSSDYVNRTGIISDGRFD